MYNRYIPTQDGQPVEISSASWSMPAQAPTQGGTLFEQIFAQLGLGKHHKETQERAVGGITSLLGLDRLGLDNGDVLLLLILLYLYQESEDEDWLIILALVLLIGL